MSDHAVAHTQALDFWFARGAVAVMAGLQIGIINDFSLGPRWLAPSVELAILLPLSVATAWTQGQARRAVTDLHWKRVARTRLAVRRAALLLTVVATVMNVGALIALVRALLSGKAGGGSALLLDALNIWTTNLIAFALWYWSIDRGGPSQRGFGRPDPDFLFPQMSAGQGGLPKAFSPGFVDYLFLSFTTATAFSPTDTLPLSHRAKLLMMLEASISLLTIALVAARAVNILG